MQMLAMLIASFLTVIVHAPSPEQASVPIDVRVTVQGLSSAESAAVVRAIRDGIESDSGVHMVYRPPRGSTPAAYVDKEFEVAPFRVSIACQRSKGQLTISSEVVDVRTERIIDRRTTNVATDDSLITSARTAAADMTGKVPR